ncbi:DNA mismatch repair protein MutS [Salinicoccus halodurans]|uniref:DNA mismatch repair protein MutS n=1 Tax=Salinicoccus halodurans TaxID=407035 RepID=A0A0F7HJH3_9STAP|nr:DNA mismatch repair protein MutS [Salinicoccus halodurans]AKG73821.1 DNA mismatch repair protein MutS [Salinicoccus halodurans]SFK56397.1 DNA mismatch repair protein MutS [Salinicoccus halodurans]
MQKVTPMMQQYLSIKDEHPDVLLLYRLGDFYELFYDDAITASKVLEITLTSRDKKKDPIPMCGVPYHSAKGYIERLIGQGYKVAICEQMEDPKQVKGMVKREVVRIITPGTLIDDFGMDDGKSNYILALQENKGMYSTAYSDISTGEIHAFTTGDLTILKSEIDRIRPSEIVVEESIAGILDELYQDPPFNTPYASDEIHALDCSDDITEDEKGTLSLLVSYIRAANMRDLKHFRTVEKHKIKETMQLNYAAISNLELLESLQTKKTKGSLFWYLNETGTPMGKRKLRKWVERPLLNESMIRLRQEAVGTLLGHFLEREDMRTLLDSVYDIERLVGRLSFGNIDAKDLVQLKDSLSVLPQMESLLRDTGMLESNLFTAFDPLRDVHAILEGSLHDSPPKTIREGGIFKDGYNEKLDELRYISNNGRTWLNGYIEDERKRTGIKNLKVGFNKVFGYYIEISKANAVNFDAEAFEYNRKQTLANAERFITPELKEMESKILSAQDESIILEYNLFNDLRNRIEMYIARLQNTADLISTLDCVISFATVANEYRLVRPEFTQNELNIEDGRHPVVEKVIGENTYVPNSLDMDGSTFIYLITGPNMSGKSTYMRQTAIISILAQMGMYVPAKSARLPIFDQIFTRIGASDDLASGKSTFMIEMMEANDALKNATKDSLLIFDEIGRGTSTYDGMALAQSMLEFIHEKIGAKTLFSTHYHEITRLGQTLPGLKNVHVKATEYDGKLVFLHKVKPGAVERSYGIHVARLAELPATVTKRADELLHMFENGTEAPSQQLELALGDSESYNDHPVVEMLKDTDVNNMTPMEALMALNEMKNRLKGE